MEVLRGVERGGRGLWPVVPLRVGVIYMCVWGGGGEVHRVQPEVVKPMPRALAQALQWGCNVSASDSELQVE